MMRRVLVSLLVLVGLGIIAAYEILWAPNTFEGDRFIIVSRGESFRQALDSLDHAGISRNRLLLDLAGRMLGVTEQVQVGKYRFKSGMSNKEILEDLRFGKTIEAITTTVIEGLRATRLAKLLLRTIGIDSSRFISILSDSSFVCNLGVDGRTLEGYLMPATYRFYWQQDEKEIIMELVKEFWKIFDDSLRARAGQLGLTISEVLSLASIIEQETAIDSERALIAGVYYNRLKRGMRLQADPTIQFLLDDGPRRLVYSDLFRESEYNTYRHEGLPPGPINSPGRASIVAALYPAQHKYMYFVANGMGGHKFNKTFVQHGRAVKQLRKFREEQEARKEAG